MMKQRSINAACRTLKKISTMPLPVRAAYDICMLMRKLDPPFQCEVEVERKLIAQHKGEFQPNGALAFPSEDERIAFDKAFNELVDVDVEIKLEPLHISFDAFDGLTLTPDEIKSLEGFIEFE